MRADNLKRVLTPVNLKYGAPMGRPNVGKHPHTITSGPNGKIFKKNQVKIFDKRVKLFDGYDIEGVYWGNGKELRVRFTPDLSYIEFYRMP